MLNPKHVPAKVKHLQLQLEKGSRLWALTVLLGPMETSSLFCASGDTSFPENRECCLGNCLKMALNRAEPPGGRTQLISDAMGPRQGSVFLGLSFLPCNVSR